MEQFTLDWNQVNTIVVPEYMKKARQQIWGTTPWLTRLEGRAKRRAMSNNFHQQLRVRPEAVQWYTGTDTQDGTIRDPYTMGSFFAKNILAPLAIDEIQELELTTEQAVFDWMDDRMVNLEDTVRDAVTIAAFGAATDARAIDGLQYLIPANTATVAQTYAGITCGGTTYDLDANGYWQPNGDVTAYTAGTDFMDGTSSNNPMISMLGRIYLRSGKRPSLIVSNIGSWTDFHNSISKNEQWQRPQQSTEMAKKGFRALMYQDLPWITDWRAPRTASAHEKVYLIDESALHFRIDPRRDFFFEPFRKPTLQQSRIGFLKFRACMYIVERRTSGVINDVDCSTLFV